MSSESFYAELESFTDFDHVIENKRFHPLPADWLIGVTDVIDSTGAINSGRYKAVNMAGACVISAVMNVLGPTPFPFVFGGDGAGFGVPEGQRDPVEAALAACQVWVEEEIGLGLRAALVPIGDIRQVGLEATVARFQPAPGVSYAMFSGGGVAWAESEMKSGRYSVPPAPAGTHPDLTGLSCRFRPLKARNGEILSLLVLPAKQGDSEAFSRLITSVLGILEKETDRQGHPVAPEGPRFVWPPQGLDTETRAGSGAEGRTQRRLKILLEHLIPWFLQITRQSVKRFDPAVYRRDTARNTDFRKFDDGLKLTVDCPQGVTARIEELLRHAQEAGVAYYGLHCQDSALMTCIVPSPFANDHMHFVDGASGGYAKAAEMLKAALSEQEERT
jgi:hypothetical protein